MGVALSLTRSPRQYFRVLKLTSQEWEKCNRYYLIRTVKEFYAKRVVDFKEQNDGTIKIVLTEKGRKRFLKYKLDDMEISIPRRWDGLWRLVIFDIPEKKKRARNALREKLKELGFSELQKSVFVFPYECQNEIDFIIEVFEIRSYVRYAVMKSITNEAELKLKFELY